MSILKTPQEIIHDLKKTMSGHEIANMLDVRLNLSTNWQTGKEKIPVTKLSIS